MPWHGLKVVGVKQYLCGYCGANVADNKGYYRDEEKEKENRIYICPNCEKPTFFDNKGHQFPGMVTGKKVEHLPQQLEQLYLEARNCCAVLAFTASVLASRKMLMNIAVQQGAKEGLKFIEYVEYLASNGYIPPNGKTWVDHIRRKGNEATHEIALMAQEDAEELIVFTEMLLKFIYEFPNRVPSIP